MIKVLSVTMLFLLNLISINLNAFSSTDEQLKPIHPLALSWGANLKLVNFDKSQEEKIKGAVSLIKRVITSQVFRDKVLNYQYQGKKKFVDNLGLSNEEIYLKILEGTEQVGITKRNNVMDVELELYNQTTNTIGYTYPDTPRIWINKKYFTRFSHAKVAHNLMHEWMHKLGFIHETYWSKERDHSVPYAIGALVEEIACRLARE
jgi:hypothetical protein